MKKLLMAAGLCALFATPGLAAEPVKLSLAQMDMLTAGFSIRIRDVNVNVAVLDQKNVSIRRVLCGQPDQRGRGVAEYRRLAAVSLAVC